MDRHFDIIELYSWLYKHDILLEITNDSDGIRAVFEDLTLETPIVEVEFEYKDSSMVKVLCEVASDIFAEREGK